jgi:UDP-glucose:glycoprotein glucosyltransferase
MPHSQLHLTIRETAAVEDPEIFWPLLDSLTQPELGIYETEKEYYEKVLELLGDGFLSDPVTLGSFELGLSLHTAAPKIEAYYQFYNTSVVPSLEGNYYSSCETWVYWRGQQICSPDGLDNVLREQGTNPRWPLKSLF